MSRNRWMLKLWTATAMVAMIAGFSVRVPAQTIPVPKSGAGGEGTGIVNDWSHHHVVFSNPGTEQEAIQKGPQAHARWLRVTSDPRYLMQAKIRSTEDRSTSETPAGSASSNPTTDTALAISKTPSPAKTLPLRAYSPIKRDWSLSLGSGFVAANMSPAKFDFDGGATTLTSTNCTEDFVVYGLNVAGSASQANLVGVDNLYSGTSPTGLCGTVPTVKYAYNVTTLTGGTVTTSPTLSYDGTMVAFIESTGSATVLHVLRWKDSDGTVAVPATDLVSAPSAFACSAPCMSSLTLPTGGTTFSSPFVDLQDNILYVANDAGQLFIVTNIFDGTPTLTTTLTVAAGVKLSAPVLDFVSGNVFIGGSDGNLYGVIPSLTVSHIAVGSGSANGGGIVDGPILDETTEMVTAFTAANAANVGGTGLTANSHAVAVQTDAAGPFASTNVATLGEGSLGTTASLNMVDGSFDNSYFTWSGTNPNTGNLYSIGTVSNTTAPTVYQIPFSGIGGVNLTGGGGGYTNLANIATISGDGSGATLAATGSVDNVIVSTAGSYTTMPTSVTFGAAPAGGTTATGTPSVGLLAITGSGGSGFTSVPPVLNAGTGSGGVATAVMGVNTITASGGSYTGSLPTIGFTGGGGTGAGATPLMGLSSIAVNTGGSFTSLPAIAIAGGTGSGGAATPNLGVTAIALNSGGSGYTAPPTINFAGTPNPGGAASATALMGLNTMTASGGSYTTLPTIVFTPNMGTSTAAPLMGLQSIAGSGGSFTSLPTISLNLNGGTGTTGTATPNMGVSTIVLSNTGGSGYTAPPTITFGGTVITPASATAVMGLNTMTASGGSYTTLPTITFTPNMGTSSASPLMGLASVSGSGGSYASLGAAAISVTGTGTGGTATPNLGVATISGAGGSGYTAPASITFAGTVISTASATAVMGVNTITVTNAGSQTGYTAVPTVNLTTSGSSTAATTTAVLGVTSVTIGSGGTYTTIPSSVTFGSGTAAATASGAVSAVTGISTSACYRISSGDPTVTFSATSGTLALGTANLGSSGSGGCITGRAPVTSVTINTAGTKYNSATVTFSGGNCSGTCPATGSVTLTVNAITVTGNGNYTGVPTAALTGGSPTASLTAVLNVTSVTVNTAGTGYTANPTVSFSAGNAAATSDLKVLSVSVGATGSYNNSFPAASASGGTTNPTLVTIATLVGANVTAVGSYTGIPGATIGGGPILSTTGTVVGATITAAGSGYTTRPTVGFSAGAATGSVTDLKVVSVGSITAGSYNNSLPAAATTGGATFTTTYTLVGTNITAPGSETAIATATVTGGVPTLTVTSTVVGANVTAPGSGYTSRPAVSFSAGAATGSVTDLKVVGVGSITAGSYNNSFPTASTTGGATFTSTTATIETVNITGVGSYSGFPTAMTSGASYTVTATVVGATVGAAGTGYTSLPGVTFTPPGATGSTVDLKVVSVTVGTPGTYTTFPSASITAGTTNPTLTTTAKVVSVTIGNHGLGYVTNPSVSFPNGTHSVLAVASSTLNVTALTVSYGGGGYSTAAVVFSAGGTGTATGSVLTINDGSVMTAGTPNVSRAVSATTAVQASPITEIFTNTSTDLMFYGFGNASLGTIVSQDITGGGAIPAPTATFTVPNAVGGTSAIVVDNIASQAQASSIYFATLAPQSFSGTLTVNIASITSPGCTAGFGSCTDTATVTTQTSETFVTGESITIAGTIPTTPNNFNGSKTITVVSSTQFTFTACTASFFGSCTAQNATTNTGTAAGGPGGFAAVKLTQSGLQ